jgi:hypothetical protein
MYALCKSTAMLGVCKNGAADDVKTCFRNIGPDWWNPKGAYEFIDMLEVKGKIILDSGAGRRNRWNSCSGSCLSLLP